MKQNYKPILLGVALAATGLFAACEKQEMEQPGKSGLLTQKSGLSAKQKSKVDNYRKAAKILADLLKEDQSFVQKVKQGIKLSRPGQENVTLKELLDEASKSKEIAAGAADFKKKFKGLEELHKAKDKQAGITDATTADD